MDLWGENIKPDTLVFDGDCELCCWSRDWLRRWDRSGRICFLAFQDPDFKTRFPGFDRSDPDGVWPPGLPPRAMLYVDGVGKTWVGVSAFRKMLPRLPWGKFLAALFYLPGIPRLAGWFYERLAQNRYRWFGPSRSRFSDGS
ncbi:MAG TPA: DUF393 domain-containing protein [Nitrospiria bacterium]